MKNNLHIGVGRSIDMNEAQGNLRILISDRLKSIRKHSKFSQSDIARKVGLTQQQIQKYESGVSAISVQRLLMILDVCNCSITEFFSEIKTNISHNESKTTISIEISLLISVYNSIDNFEDRLKALAAVAVLARVKSSEISNVGLPQ